MDNRPISNDPTTSSLAKHQAVDQAIVDFIAVYAPEYGPDYVNSCLENADGKDAARHLSETLESRPEINIVVDEGCAYNLAKNFIANYDCNVDENTQFENICNEYLDELAEELN